MVFVLIDAYDIAEQSRSVVLIKARAILDFHHAGPDASCDGCLQQWARLAPVPCEAARWAHLVVGARGALVDDVLSERTSPG